MTSPPYWGLRDYGTNPQIWGGEPDCQHQWHHFIKPASNGIVEGAITGPTLSPHAGTWRPHMSQICSLCNAWRGELGLEPDFCLYIEHLCAVFDGIKRVVKSTASVWVNLGDTYWSAKGSCFNPGGGQHSLETSRREVYPLHRGNKTDIPWLRPKSLCQIPNRFAIAMTDRGWILRNDIIWCKPNGMPSSVKDRLTNKYEHIFHFVKSRHYYYDLDPIRVPHTSLHPQGHSWRTLEGRTMHTQRHLLGLRKAGAGYIGHASGKNPGDVMQIGADVATTAPRSRGLCAMEFHGEPDDSLDFWKREVLESFRCIGKATGRRFRGKHNQLSKNSFRTALNSGQARTAVNAIIDGLDIPAGVKRELKRWWHDHSGHVQGTNPGDLWKVATRPFPEAHFAVYPETLCELPIKATCPPAVCSECGKPRQRIIEKSGYSGRSRKDNGHRRHVPGFKERENRSQWGEKPVHVTTGWTSCHCNAGFRPGVVFDPFAGAGTTLVVAKKLGRLYLGCDLKPAYVKLANRRLRETPCRA
ncbi:MAG: site-specific DNA-methyltransferase [Acidobacteria bacterium]|nr:site-specific DNA-methyltransferase [Acidobacteriota bacterium]